MCEGSGGALRENAEDVFRALPNREPRHFVQVVATRAVPRDDLVMDVNGLRKRLVALCVGGVDRFPEWKARRRISRAKVSRSGLGLSPRATRFAMIARAESSTVK